MKKFVGICICLLLALTFVIPTGAMASAVESDAGDIIYFLNPSAIAVQGDYLFVADNIEDEKCVILCFNIGGEKPVYKFTEEVDGKVLNLSAKSEEDNGLRIYAIFADKVTEYLLLDEKALAVSRVFHLDGVVDFTYGVINTDDDKGEYYATKQAFYSRDPRMSNPEETGYFAPIGFGSQSDVSGVLAIGQFVYCLFKSDGTVVCQRIDGQIGRPANPATDALNKNTAMLSGISPAPTGLFVWNDDSGEQHPAVFSESGVWNITISGSLSGIDPLLSPDDYDSEEHGKIVDVESKDGALYVLNSNHKIEIYRKSETSGKYESNATVGTEIFDTKVPALAELNSFTLVRSTGYPTNIVFRTSGERSVDNLIEDAEEYIVLGYDGDENSPFYYVLVGDSFGWVKKSDNSAGADQDSKLTVVNTKMSNDDVEYKSKLNSLNGVFIAPLPRNSFLTKEYWTVLEQTAQTMTEVTLLQRFTEGNVVWYYVRYGENKMGFVTEENVGKFYIEANTSNTTVEGQRKANSVLFSFVQMYDNNDPATMDEEHLACFTDGTEVPHLKSNQRITLIKTYDNGTALVQVIFGNGQTATGYVFADRLISPNALTTNAIFGLVAVGFALLLAMLITVVVVKKKKAKK